MDEQALAGAQAALGEERVVGGGEDLRDAAGRVPVELVGDGDGEALVDGDQLGLAAAADHGHDAVAGLEAVHARAALGDLAGELEPGDVGRRARRRGVDALHLQDVGAVEAGGADADEDLARQPGSGSGCSSTATAPSRTVTARMAGIVGARGGRAARRRVRKTIRPGGAGRRDLR